MNQYLEKIWSKINELKFLLFIIFLILSIFMVILNFDKIYGDETYGVQFTVIFSLFFISLLLVIARIENKPDIDVYSIETAKLLFSTLIQFLVTMYAFFGIGFTILWGNLYTFGLEAGNMKYIQNLMIQGVTLLAFISIFSVTILATLIYPLWQKIKSVNEAIKIFKEIYDKGEITKKQYEQIKNKLE